MDWVITIPKTTNWDDYTKELKTVENGNHVMNYKVSFFPKSMKVGDRCFVVWNGKVRGWMNIVGLVEYNDNWRCSTTGTVWSRGKYIRRSGKFHEVDGPEMIGFRGIRKYFGE